MNRIAVRSALVVLLVAPTLSGCLAKTAFDIVTLPVKVASKGIDAATTSQSEADEKRGRELRERDERLGRLERRYAEEMADCEGGSEAACEDARRTYAELETLLPATAPEN